MNFTNVSQEVLEDELRRCNGIMAEDGKKIGKLVGERDRLLAASNALLDVLRTLAKGPQHDAMVELCGVIESIGGTGVSKPKPVSLFFAVTGAIPGDTSVTHYIEATSKIEAIECFEREIYKDTMEDPDNVESEHGCVAFIDNVVASHTPFVDLDTLENEEAVSSSVKQ